jgi:hypothetical protein
MPGQELSGERGVADATRDRVGRQINKLPEMI